MSNKVFLGLGSNLNKSNALRFALAKLKEFLGDVTISSVYQNKAVRKAEPDYYNMVIRANTSLTLDALYNKLLEIEDEAGSEMMFFEGTNFGIKPRIDIDVLTYGDLVESTPCKVPRHDIQDYPFVLCPLTEIEPDFVHPLLNIKVKEIWDEMCPRLPEHMVVTKIDFDFKKPFASWDDKE